MSEQQPSPPRPTFYSLLSETTRLLFTHRGHFLILSLLFLLPQSLFDTSYYVLIGFDAKSPTAASIILHVIYQTLSFVISFLAIGSISFSSYNFFLRRPIKLTSSVRSLQLSFPRLLITSSPLLLIACVARMNDILWNKIDQSSPYYLMAVYIGMVVTFYLHINLALLSAIVVIESKCGLEPLRRSIHLMQGMRRALALLMLFSGAISWGTVSYLIKQLDNDDDDSMKSYLLFFVWRIVVDTGVRMVLMLVSIIATTVLYCKAARVDVLPPQNVSQPLVDDADKT